MTDDEILNLFQAALSLVPQVMAQAQPWGVNPYEVGTVASVSSRKVQLTIGGVNSGYYYPVMVHYTTPTIGDVVALQRRNGEGIVLGKIG